MNAELLGDFMSTGKQMNSDNNETLRQPMQPEEVSPEQKAETRRILDTEENLTLNPGDRIDESKTLEEKAKQVAVDAPDITGDHIVVPTYFIVEDKADGHKEALHHVKDAEKISDVIRQARTNEKGEREWW